MTNSRRDHVIEELRARVEGSVETYVGRVLELQDYHDGLVEESDIRQTARTSFDALIHQVFTRDPSGSEPLEETARDLVSRRHNQGVHLDPLLTAVRLDFTVLWELLRSICDPDDVDLVVDLAEPLWRAVEDYANGVYRAYLEQTERQVREESVLRQEYLVQALHRDASVETIHQVSRILGFEVTESLVLCVAAGGLGRGLQKVMSQALHLLRPAHLVNVDGYAVLIFPAGCDDLRQQVAEVPCAVVGPVRGLGGARAQMRLAQRIAEVVSGEDMALTPELAWPRIARSALEDVGLGLREAIASGMSGAREGEAERIEATVRRFLDLGSVAEVAKSIPCHRNTVQNHLNRFRDMTGIDLGVPSQAARVVLAWG